jgi:hypothetical protein
MIPRAENRRACALWLGYIVALGCASPDLSRVLFSCATDADCAPGQRCAAFQGELACQFASALPSDGCTEGSCDVPSVMAGNAPLLPATPLESVSSSPEAPRLDTPLADPSRSDDEALEPSSSSASAMAPADAGLAPASASVRFDFESDLEGWQIYPNQRPLDALDTVEQSSALAHHGTGALRMAFDGNYTPSPPFAFDAGPLYGVYEVGAPPPGVDVGLWMFSTAPGMSVEVYVQSGAAFDWTVLATVPLLANQWREITVTMPLLEARQFGIRLYSPLDFAGVVYLDEIRW